MKFILTVISFIFCTLISTPLLAEGMPWQVFSNLNYTKDEIGFINEDIYYISHPSIRRYFIKNLSSAKLKQVTEDEFKKKFNLSTLKPTLINDRALSTRLYLGVSLPPTSDIVAQYEKCINYERTPEEYALLTDKEKKAIEAEREIPPEDQPIISYGEEMFQGCQLIYLNVKDKKIQLQQAKTWGCKRLDCFVVAANIIDDKIWVGYGSIGEYQWYGSNYQVYDLSGNLLYTKEKSPKREEPYQHELSLITEFIKNPNSGNIDISSSKGIVTINPDSYELISHYLITPQINREKLITEFVWNNEKDKVEANNYSRFAITHKLENNQEFHKILISLQDNKKDCEEYISINIRKCPILAAGVINDLGEGAALWYFYILIEFDLIEEIRSKSNIKKPVLDMIKKFDGKNPLENEKIKFFQNLIKTFSVLNCKEKAYNQEQVSAVSNLLKKYQSLHPQTLSINDYTTTCSD